MSAEKNGICQSPITLWNLTKLYNSEVLVSENDLLKELCEASFDMLMEDKGNPTKFKESLRYLLGENLIIYKEPPYKLDEGKFRLDVKYYQISQKGILFFRENVINVIRESRYKAVNTTGEIYFLEDKNAQQNNTIVFHEYFKEARKQLLDYNKELAITIVKLILENSPLMVKALSWCLGYLSG